MTKSLNCQDICYINFPLYRNFKNYLINFMELGLSYSKLKRMVHRKHMEIVQSSLLLNINAETLNTALLFTVIKTPLYCASKLL